MHRIQDKILQFVAEEFGTVKEVVPAGHFPGTYRIRAGNAALIAKRMDNCRAPGEFTLFFNAMKSVRIPCPELLKCIELDECWFALFPFIEGHIPRHSSPAVQKETFELLVKLRNFSATVPGWNLEEMWLSRFTGPAFSSNPAKVLLENLLKSAPDGKQTLAHGDFAPQNFLQTEKGLILLDWEETGKAHTGFDAGWLLALNSIGAGLQMAERLLFEELLRAGFPERNLLWFKGLGLLRLLYRAHTLTIHPSVRRNLTAKILEAIRAAAV